MGEQGNSWKTWKARWKFTEKNAVNIVKRIFRLRGIRPIERKELTILEPDDIAYQDGLDFAIELGWLKDCLNDTYKITSVGLMMLCHRIKD